jgi:biopolymer transport protein ExbB
MIPIALMSFIVVAFSLERALALRRGKVIPKRFVRALGELASAPGGFDPRAAYKLCQENRSAAAEVIRAALLKVGRPLSEIEHAVAEASDREAARLYANVRPIHLAVTITPLLGLLGTVQGMIQAFFVTAESPLGVNKAQNLAAGIYVALVTTFAGLSVAIPAAIISHYFEGRIQRLFHHIDDLAQSLLPQLERYEGKLRTGRGELGYLVEAQPGQRAPDLPMRPEVEPPPVRAPGEPPRHAVNPTEA